MPSAMAAKIEKIVSTNKCQESSGIEKDTPEWREYWVVAAVRSSHVPGCSLNGHRLSLRGELGAQSGSGRYVGWSAEHLIIEEMEHILVCGLLSAVRNCCRERQQESVDIVIRETDGDFICVIMRNVH